MNVRVELNRVVPRLRRYARAVLVDGAAADDCVARALADVAHAPPPAKADLTLAFFRLLDWHLREREDQSEVSPPETGRGLVDAGLHALTPIERRVLLLHGLERFEAPSIARIVDRPVTEVELRLTAAYAALEGRGARRILVCQGDRDRAASLASAVREAGHEVVGIANDASRAVSLAREAAADLIVADIDRVDDTPCEAALAAVRALVDVGCVVVTTGSERALASLSDTPVLLLSKPLDPRLLNVAFAQALRPAPGVAS